MKKSKTQRLPSYYVNNVTSLPMKERYMNFNNDSVTGAPLKQ